jgi:predicted enzyme related to lactoylglutathione lyase
MTHLLPRPNAFRHIVGSVLAVGLLAGCGSDDNTNATATTTAPLATAATPAQTSAPATQAPATRTTGALKLEAIEFVIVNVTDLKTSSAFYGDLLGWTPIETTPTNQLGLVGDLAINLVLSDSPGTPSMAGVAVIGFRSTDIETAAAALTSAAVKFERAEFPLPDGGVNDLLSFVDPDGTAINVVARQR